MNSKKIIALIGEPLAGKDTVAKYLVVRYKAEEIRYSYVLDDILRALALDISRANEAPLAVSLRQTFGTNVLSRAVLVRAGQSQSELVILNGIRVAEEISEAKAMGATLMHVTAPVEARYGRYLKRGQKADDGTLGLEQFIEKNDKSETDKDIPELGNKADIKIDNTGSLEELYAKVDKYVETLRRQ